MRARTVPCPACGRRWTGTQLRFCGACGAPLPVPDRAPPHRAMRTVVAMTLGIAVVATLALLARAIPDELTSAQRDAQVALPEEAPDTPPAITDAEAEQLLDRADRHRLRCEPRGCELWRRERSEPSGLVSVADLIVVLERQELVALDAATGEQRWTAPVGRLRSYSSEEGQVRDTGSRAEIHASSDGSGVLLATSNEVSLVDLHGRRAWSRRPEPGTQWQWAVGDETLVQHGAPGQRRPTQLRGIDVATGAVQWRAEAASVHLADPDVVVVALPATGRLQALETATGTPLWERTSHGRRAVSFGPWIAHNRSDGVTLLDRATGEVAGAVGGYVYHPPVRAGDRWLSVVTGDPQGWTVDHLSPLALVALTDGAEVAWRLPLRRDQAEGCCSLLVDDEAETVSVIGSQAVLEVRVDTGEIAAVTRHDDETPAGDGTDRPGELRLLVGDDQIAVHGREVWIESLDPLVVGSPEHLMGVRTVSDPVSRRATPYPRGSDGEARDPHGTTVPGLWRAVDPP